MYRVSYSKKSRKQLKRLTRSGLFDRAALEDVLLVLVRGEKLEPKYRDHRLNGSLGDHHECHLSNGILLMYQVNEQDKEIVVVEIGTHSELFGR